MTAPVTFQHWRLHLPLRVRFGHASATRDATETVLVLAQSRTADGGTLTGLGEACPRDYVTGETEQSVEAFCQQHQDMLGRIAGLDTLRQWIRDHSAQIDQNPAAFAAMECALLDVLARRAGQTVEQFLDLPPVDGTYFYSAILGDAAPARFRLQAWAYRLAGFRDFKVKLSADPDRDRDKLQTLNHLRLFGSLTIRADANNLWPDADACIRHVSQLPVRLHALEEPVAARDRAEQMAIVHRLGLRIILDESLVTPADMAACLDQPDLFVANIRISKNGGILRSLALVRQAEQAGLPVIIGAHVGESSILTRAALTVANAPGRPLLAQEGAFGRLLVPDDPVTPSLRFGYGGRLRATGRKCFEAPGFGLYLAD